MPSWHACVHVCVWWEARDGNTAIITFQNNQKYTGLTCIDELLLMCRIISICYIYYSVAMIRSVSGRAEHTMGCQV